MINEPLRTSQQSMSCEHDVVKEPCGEEDPSLALCETESSSSESETSSTTSTNNDDSPSSLRKTVTFQNVEIKEYDMVRVVLCGDSHFTVSNEGFDLCEKFDPFPDTCIFFSQQILGDHPATTIGPSITIEWNPVRTHVLSVDDYESAFDEGKRRGQELRMPESVRKALLAGFHSEHEMRKSRSEVRKIQAQRNMSRAMEEMEA